MRVGPPRGCDAWFPIRCWCLTTARSGLTRYKRLCTKRPSFYDGPHKFDTEMQNEAFDRPHIAPAVPPRRRSGWILFLRSGSDIVNRPNANGR
jgi:hypothetical protein